MDFKKCQGQNCFFFNIFENYFSRTIMSFFNEIFQGLNREFFNYIFLNVCQGRNRKLKKKYIFQRQRFGFSNIFLWKNALIFFKYFSTTKSWIIISRTNLYFFLSFPKDKIANLRKDISKTKS